MFCAPDWPTTPPASPSLQDEYVFPIYQDPIYEGPEPETPIPRLPLQELPVTPFGDLVGCREPSWRPVPSADKENLPALRDALDQRDHILTQRDLDISAVLHQMNLHRDRLERSLQDISAEPMDADCDPGPFVATHLSANSRLSMPLDSDDSSSEPDLSVLGIARAGAGLEHHMNAMAYDDDDDDDDDEVLSQEQYEAEDTSIEDQDQDQEAASLFDPATVGLKEISNLGKFTVSSHKPGSGIDELRSDDLKQYWQSDGPQPHRLTVYFVKRVGIRDIRFFVDYNEDESYTPTKIIFKSGTSENNLIEFATMNLDSPVGWQQVPIAGAGGEPDGNTLVSYVLQMQILENHQNGKDTHLRGIKIYAFDADAAQGAGREGGSVADDAMDLTGVSGVLGTGHGDSGDRLGDIARTLAVARLESGETGFTIPDFMREPELR